MEQLLLTSPGERVNRPDFGSGLLQAIFAPNSPELATAQEFTTRAALQRWLGDAIEVRELRFVAEDSTLRVQLSYAVKRTGEQRNEVFELGTHAMNASPQLYCRDDRERRQRVARRVSERHRLCRGRR